MALQFTLNPDQRAFIASTRRFCCYKSGWATGKSMCLIMKMAALGQMYRDNLILICRREYTDLKNSTILDWQRYTKLTRGMKFLTQAKECRFPNGSRVIFSHADALEGVLQNITLGAFAIEQGEEFPDSEVWTMLSRGRLRRSLELDEQAWEIVDRIHAEDPPEPDMKAFYDHLRTHTGMNSYNPGVVAANANGRNWIWQMWKRDSTPTDLNKHSRLWENPQRPEFMMIESDSYANSHNIPYATVKGWDDMANGTQMEQRKRRIFVLNLDDEIDLEGAYYANLMSDARMEQRVGFFRPDKSAATHTAWDLGIGDTTAIWFFQKLGQEIRCVHAYENDGEGLEHYIRYVETVGKRLGLHYGQHFWPHDGKNKQFVTGQELHKTAKDMGLTVTHVPKDKKLTDDVFERVRKMLPYCTFDAKECQRGIEALEHYQRRKNRYTSTEDKTVYSDTPLHDWASNLADAFRYLSLGVRKIGGGMSKERVRELLAAYS